MTDQALQTVYREFKTLAATADDQLDRVQLLTDELHRLIKASIDDRSLQVSSQHVLDAMKAAFGVSS